MYARVTLSVICFLAAITLSGCATVLPPEQQDVLISNDTFSKSVEIVGVKGFVNPFGGTTKTWFLRSWVDKAKGTTRHQLYATLGYDSDWRFYEGAADERAVELDAISIDRSVVYCSASSCLLHETVGVDVSDKVLRRHATTGYSVKIYARSGDAEVLELSPIMIQKQLSAIEQVRAR